MSRFLLACGLFPIGCLAGQQPAAAPRQDSVNVSAGISKGQLELEKPLRAILEQAEKSRSQHEYVTALNDFKKPWDMVRSDSRLAEWQDRVLEKLAHACLDAKQPEEAIRNYTALIQLRNDDCGPAAKWSSECADAQRQLGLAHMQKGDFSAALPFLREAIANYGRAANRDQLEEFRMIALMHQAEVQTLMAAALVRSEKRSEALEALDCAVEKLEKVQRDENIQTAVRNSARESLQEAQHVQALIRSN